MGSSVVIPAGFEVEQPDATPAIPAGFEVEQASKPAKPSLNATMSAEPKPTLWQRLTSPIVGGMTGDVRAKDTAISRATGHSQEPAAESSRTPNLIEAGNAISDVGPGVARGTADFASGLTSPSNLAIMGATSGLGALETQVGKSAISKLVSLGFSGQMVYDAASRVPEVAHAIASGDWATARQAMTQMGLGVGMAALGVKHALSGRGAAEGTGATEEAAPAPSPTPAAEEASPAPVAPSLEEQLAAARAENAKLKAKPAAPTIPDGFEVERPLDETPPATPTPDATAAQPTVPEAPDTLQVQMTQLNQGKRNVVMFPKGTDVPQLPEGTATHQDAFGNTYAYDADKIQPATIDAAVASNRLPEILGDARAGMGAPDKSALQGDPVAVVSRTMDGTTVQATATDEAHLQETIDAAKKVTPPGGAVSVEPAENEIAARQEQAGQPAGSPGEPLAPEVEAAPPDTGGILNPSPEEVTAAKSRIKARIAELVTGEGGEQQFNLDPRDLADLVVIGTHYIRQTGRNFQAWSTEMRKEFGDVLEPHLMSIYTRARQAVGGMAPDTPPPPGLKEPAPARAGEGPSLVGKRAPVLEFPGNDTVNAAPAEPPAPAAPKVVQFPGRASERGSMPADILTAPAVAADKVLGASAFVTRDAVPTVKAFVDGGATFIRGLVHMVAPRTGVPPKLLDEVYRMKGGRDAAQYLLHQQLDEWDGRVGKMTEPEMVDFIDRQKTGKPQADPALQGLSDFLRNADDEIYKQLKKYKPSLSYLEDHYRVMWKVIPRAADSLDLDQPGAPGFKGPSVRPLQGTKGMLKQHTLDTMSEGIDRGGVPVSFNPMRMFELSYADSMKFITAQRMWDSYKDLGARKFVKNGQGAKAREQGFVPLDDRIAKTYFPTDAGLVNTGEWYVEKGAARVLNNFLSRDLLREQGTALGTAGRAMMGVKNATTAIELSMSPFHLVFEGNEAIGSQVGIGLRKMYNLGLRKGDIGAFTEGARDIATAPASVVNTARLGSMAKQAFGNFDEFSRTPDGQKFLKQYPDARELVQDYFQGGGRIGMHEDYKIQAYNSFREELNAGNWAGAAIRGVPLLNQAIMKPLFEQYIPNLKLGFFLKEYSLARQEYADRLASGEMTNEQLSRKVVDSVENRFGEMNFDNLYWNRTFKTAMQLAFRSVTWKLGNIREYSSALAGQGAELVRAAREGKAPLLHPSMSWLIGMSLWTAVLGGTIHTLATGKAPQQLKDVIYPVIDGATGIRASVPTYWRDMMHAQHSPLGYATSGLSGEIGRLADVWRNKDFYGNEVRNQDDSLGRQTMDSLKHLVPSPFSVQSAKQASAQGGSTMAKIAGYTGFTKAPRYIEQTPAQEMASDYAQQHREVGSRTQAQAAASQARSGILSIMRAGRDPSEQIQKAIAQGLITNRDVPQLRKIARTDALANQVQRLSLTEALNVYDKATPDERQQIARVMRVKVSGARSKPQGWTPRAAQLSQQYFGIRPVRLPDLSAPGPVQ